MVDSDIVGIIILNSDGLLTEANDAFLELLNGTRQQLLKGEITLNSITPEEYQEVDERSVVQLRRRRLRVDARRSWKPWQLGCSSVA